MGMDMKYGRIDIPKKNNIGKDEPVFLIRAKDKLSLSTIRAYISEYSDLVEGDPGTAKFMSDLWQALDNFETWQKNNQTKLPD